MEVVRYDTDSKAKVLERALEILRNEGTVVYPTETAYGLGADFYSPVAYSSIYTIKYRDKNKVLPVIVPDSTYARTLVEFSPLAARLAAEYWPGPLTLVLPFLYARHFPHHSDAFLALRVSSHPLAAELARFFGHPLISTSANMASQPVCYTAEEVVLQMKNAKKQPDLIIDVGPIPQSTPSTILRIEGNRMTVLRQGSVQINPKKYV